MRVTTVPDFSSLRRVDLVAPQRERWRPPVRAACDGHDISRLGVDLERAYAAALVFAPDHPGSAADERDVPHGGQRDVLENRQRATLRVWTQLTVGTDNQPANTKIGRLNLEAGQASHVVALLTNVGAKRQSHGVLRW